MGRESVLIGNRFEQWLEITHRRYLADGKAWVEKNPVPARFVAIGDPSRRLVPTGKALPDYGGWLAGGRGVLFEAKSTNNKERWTPPEDREHQYDYLVTAWKFGLAAFYLVEWRAHEEVRLYPIQQVPTPYGKPFLRLLGALVYDRDGILDWLSIVEQEVPE